MVELSLGQNVFCIPVGDVREYRGMRVYLFLKVHAVQFLGSIEQMGWALSEDNTCPLEMSDYNYNKPDPAPASHGSSCLHIATIAAMMELHIWL